MFGIVNMVLSVLVTVVVLLQCPRVLSLTARECVEYVFPQGDAQTSNLQLTFTESVVVSLRPYSKSRFNISVNKGQRRGKKKKENGIISANTTEGKENGSPRVNLTTNSEIITPPSPQWSSSLKGQIISKDARQAVETISVAKSQEEKDRRQETPSQRILNRPPTGPTGVNPNQPNVPAVVTTTTGTAEVPTERTSTPSPTKAVSPTEKASVPTRDAAAATETPPERAHGPWQATAVIKDSFGRCCNMTISETSIEVNCSSNAQGRHGDESPEEKEIFALNEWTTFIVKVHQEVAINETQAAPGPPVSNNSRTRVATASAGILASSHTSTLELGLRGNSHYIVLARDTGLQGPMTIEWETGASLGVVYNCWNDCDVAYKRLLSTNGPRDLYLLMENDFEGMNITYVTPGVLPSSSYTLTASDFERYHKERWMRISLQRGLASLKVVVDNVVLKDITNSTVGQILGLDVSLIGGGRLTWCHNITPPSWKAPVQAFSWILVCGLSIFACHTFYLLFLSYKKKLGGYQEEDGPSQEAPTSPSQAESNDENDSSNNDGEVELRGTAGTSGGSSAVKARRPQNPTASNGNGSVECINSVYYSLKRNEELQRVTTYTDESREQE